jgi:hypothetical protein
MPDNTVLCSYCRKPVTLGKDTDAVDAFIYKYGDLDEIPIWHRACAIRAGYKVGPNGHLVGYEPRERHKHLPKGLHEAVCTGCMGTGIYKHEGDATKYQCPYCKGSGQSPYPVKEDVAAGKAQTSGQFATAGFPQAEGVQRKAGQFVVTDRKGKAVGKPYPSYSAAQKADNARPKYEDTGGICREDSTAPAISKLESFTAFQKK